jgi:hypothetical protein
VRADEIPSTRRTKRAAPREAMSKTREHIERENLAAAAERLRMRELLRTLPTRHREAPKRTLAFFRALNLDAIVPALEEARAVGEGRDEIYRIFHTSFKMYYLGGAAADLVRLMLVPVGVKADAYTWQQLARAMRRWHFDDLFVDVFERTASTVWSEERNPPALWREDATQLAAGFAIVREVALASLEAMDRMRRREGFLFEAGSLDSTDALFLEVWTGLGDGLRYVRPKGLDEQSRAMLVRSTRARPRRKGARR